MMAPLESLLLAQFRDLPGLRHVAWAGAEAAQSVPMVPALLLAWDDLTWTLHAGPRWLGRYRLHCRLVQAAPSAATQVLAGQLLASPDPLLPVGHLLQVLAQVPAGWVAEAGNPPHDARYRLGPGFPTRCVPERAPAGLRMVRIEVEGLIESLQALAV